MANKDNTTQFYCPHNNDTYIVAAGSGGADIKGPIKGKRQAWTVAAIDAFYEGLLQVSGTMIKINFFTCKICKGQQKVANNLLICIM